MAIVLKETRALFVHIPKTGGTWVEAVFNKLGIANQRAPHSPAASVRHATLDQLPGDYDFRFAFVRHPVAWYESWWKFQAGAWRRFEQGRWHPQRVLENCADDDFSQFVMNCLEHQPAYVSRMYEWFLGPPGNDRFDFVGRTESLRDDLTHVLRQLGYDFDEREIEQAKPIHVSGKKLGEPVWDADLRRRVLELESPAIRRFYSNDRPERTRAIEACRAET